MSQAFSDYKKFQADEALAKTQSERAQLLFSHGALAQKDLEVAAETYDKAKVDTQTALDHVRILGGDPQHPSSVIEVHAPVSGTIVEQNVTAAAGVKSLDNSPNSVHHCRPFAGLDDLRRLRKRSGAGARGRSGADRIECVSGPQV